MGSASAEPAVHPFIKSSRAAGQGQYSCPQKICPNFLFFALQLNRNCVIVTLVQLFCCTGDCFIFYRRFFMRLRTRVLSFMLAGSMMLSATPVSAFAATPVLGGVQFRPLR